ncbi:threonine--tRNA ligase [bacterium (Candidatus Howlettbacteria) CG_4_10_14_0_8_um_filter_40_9]|nr:MAG: threonine--tRNA ligase [bacterium (Candidatus Howlettbacteria) CG_4_10_14_0_8_um_filter_40_9]
MAKEKKQNLNLETMRHSLSHIMAAAVLDMFPEAKLGIGPPIENGFYYDFDLPRTLIPEDLVLIEGKMRKIIKRNLPFEKTEAPIDYAIREAKKKKEVYKLEILNDLKKALPPNRQAHGKQGRGIMVSFYRTGDFVDLCKGPHVKSTGKVGAFKLTKISGAYWRGDEKNKMLQRIYGVAFESQKELDEYLKNMEEAEKRDHRKLGQELDLFSNPEEMGGGLPLWHPKGASLRSVIEEFWKKEHQKRGYELVYTPHIAKLDIWKTSGHWDFYRENLYSPMMIDEQEYLVKPMNCPFHIFIFKSKLRSYRELPVKYAELGTVYRYERSGVLHGLTRVRGFTQDDAHIFCTPKQLENEIIETLRLVDFMMGTFDFKYNVYLSTKPEKAVGSDKTWKESTKALESALKKTKVKYILDPGEGVFYGPKIDVKLEDSLGREWQGPTVQVDFNLPEKFNVEYVDEKGNKERVVMVHRAVLGSMERFIGVLIEHYAGAFPLWLAPVQAVVIPISDKKHGKYAHTVANLLKESGLRVEVDERPESLGRRIRDNEMQKVPYIIIVGDKEMTSKKVSVRSFKKGDLGSKSTSAFIKEMLKEIEEKK